MPLVPDSPYLNVVYIIRFFLQMFLMRRSTILSPSLLSIILSFKVECLTDYANAAGFRDYFLNCKISCFVLKKNHFFLVKQASLTKKSTALSLPIQSVFPAFNV
jgi:hypothetical protein